MNLLDQGFHQDTALKLTHMENYKFQACADTVEGNCRSCYFAELRESRIIDVEYDSDDVDDMEVMIKPRITLSGLQLLLKKTPEDLRKVGSQAEC